MPTPPRLILASASPARLKTLQNAGLSPEVIVSGVDESTVEMTGPADYTMKLAQLKAVAVAADQKRALVIGCDSVLALDGEILGKPVSDDEAVARWKQMRGRSGVLHTGHCVIDTHREVWLARSAATQVRFAHVTDEEIEAYVATGEPLSGRRGVHPRRARRGLRVRRDGRSPQRRRDQPAAAATDVRGARLRLDRVLASVASPRARRRPGCPSRRGTPPRAA